MKSKLELVTMICDLHVDAFLAGSRQDAQLINAARGDRVRLIEELNQLFNALEDSELHIKDQMRELDRLREECDERIVEAVKENDKLVEEFERVIDERDKAIEMNERLVKENNAMYAQLEKIQGPDIRDMYPEFPDHHDAFDAMFPGCTPDDLPFPEVERKHVDAVEDIAEGRRGGK